MVSPCDHPIIVSLPKSATIYFQRSFELTLALAHCPITSGFDIEEEALRRFMEQPRAMAGDHFRATEDNLRRLAEVGIRRIAVMVRDPRDALVSLWHHLEREDVKSQPWLIDALAERGINRDYFILSPEQQLAEHIEYTFPHYQRWLREWARALDVPSPFAFHLRRYEDFVQDLPRRCAACIVSSATMLSRSCPMCGATKPALIHSLTSDAALLARTVMNFPPSYAHD